MPVLLESGRLLSEVFRIDIGNDQLATGPQTSGACGPHSAEPYDGHDISHAFLPVPARDRRAITCR